jgi:hypothetical protein
VNRAFIPQVLERLGVAPGSYSAAPTSLSEGYVVERVDYAWEFSYRERGRKTHVQRFHREDDACWWLLRNVLEGLLLGDRLRTGDGLPFRDDGRERLWDPSAPRHYVTPQRMNVANLKVLADRLGLVSGLIGFGTDGPEYRYSVFETPTGWTARSRDRRGLRQVEDRLLPTELEACWALARWIMEDLESPGAT